MKRVYYPRKITVRVSQITSVTSVISKLIRDKHGYSSQAELTFNSDSDPYFLCVIWGL